MNGFVVGWMDDEFVVGQMVDEWICCWVNGWIDGCMIRPALGGGRLSRWMNKQRMDACMMNEHVGGWMAGWTDGFAVGWMGAIEWLDEGWLDEPKDHGQVEGQLNG